MAASGGTWAKGRFKPAGAAQTLPSAQAIKSVALGRFRTHFDLAEAKATVAGWPKHNQEMALNAISHLVKGKYQGAALYSGGKMVAVMAYQGPGGLNRFYSLNYLAADGQTKGAGTAMVAWMAHYAGSHGRPLKIGSTPQSQGFYKSIGLKTRGGREEEEEFYLSPQDALAFARKHNVKG